MHYDLDYDSTKPEMTIRNFVSDVKDMIARFEGNKARVIAIEEELQDIYHYIEISTYKSVPIGYKLYRKLAELRRERRSCKNENDLLQPIYEYFHATEVLNKLSHVQGECAKVKTTIDNRTYLVRTDILDKWIEPDEPVEDEIPIVEPEEEKEDVLDNKNLSTDLQIPEISVETSLPVEQSVPEEEPVYMSPKAKKIFKQVWKSTN